MRARIEPFTWGRRKPLSILLIEAQMPLVLSKPPYDDIREAFVDNARNTPGLYIEGIHLATMGGEPYSEWN